MRHAALTTRATPRRSATRALLVGLLSASLLTTGSSSLATGEVDVDVEPPVAAESVTVEPAPSAEPPAVDAAEPVTLAATSAEAELAAPTVEAPTVAEGAVAPVAEQAPVETAPAASADSDDGPEVAPSSTVTPMGTGSWSYQISSTSPSRNSRIQPSTTITYDLRAAVVGLFSSSDDNEVYLELTSSPDGALLEHVTLEGVRQSQGTVSVTGLDGTWKVGRLSGWLGDAETATLRATIGADAPEGTLTATITGNARGTRSGGYGSVSHTIDYRHSTITVDAGGLRTGLGTNAIDGTDTEGARYALYQSESSAQPFPGGWATCTTDADGECVFEGVPPGQYWVGQIDSLSGSPAAERYNPVTTVTTGTAGSFTDRSYRLQTPYVNDSDYRMPAQDARGGSWAENSDVWPNRLNNPSLAPTCQAGLDIALLMDLSGSVVPNRDDLRDAARGFVGALSGTGSQVALFSFGDASPRPGTSNYPTPLNVDTGNNATTLRNRIGTYWDYTQLDQGTNWDAGLWAVANTEFVKVDETRGS